MNTKRKLLAIVLTLCMALSLVPVGALADGEPAAQEYTWETLQGAMNTGDTIKLGADVTCTDQTLGSLVVPADKTVTLDLNGFTIDRGRLKVPAVDNGNVITVNGNLTVTDSSATNADKTDGTGQITGGRNNNNGGGVIVYGGTFILESGTICSNYAGKESGFNESTKYGGGVYVNSGGIFTMNGGAICNNTSSCSGGGVYVNSDGTFTMNGGAIRGNTTYWGSVYANGGGVYVGGIFNVSGSPVISGNTIDSTPQNVYLPSDKRIIIKNETTLDSAAHIGVTSAAIEVPVIITSGLSGKGSVDSFYSDAKKTITNSNGEAAIGSDPVAWKALQDQLKESQRDPIVLDADYLCADPGWGPLEVPTGVTNILDLNGYVIDRGLTEAAKNGNVITVNGNLTVKDSTASDSNPTGSGKITGGFNSGDGGGVYVDEGTITLSGGTISGNQAKHGGGVYMSGGAFTMNDGAISGNTANYSDGGNGGGVFVGSDCSFEMTNGTISGNKAEGEYSDGGGVYVYLGTFKMTGNECKIIENQAFEGGGVFGQQTTEFSMKNGTISQNQAGFGGGVSVYLCTFTMEGGKISGNHAAYAGNGVSVSGEHGKGLFDMKGGEVSENTPIVVDNTTAKVYGGGVYVDHAALNLTAGKISNNLSTDGGGVYFTREATEGGTEGEVPSLMSGGEITGNKAMGAGGGVNLDSGEFTMTGGLISSNVSYGEATVLPQCGGGVYIGNGEFTMGGETNTPVIEKNQSDYGGGVYVYPEGAFNIKGNLKIADNQAGTWSGEGTARTLGDTRVENIYLSKVNDDAVIPIKVIGKLTNQTPIGVTTEIEPTQGKPVVFTAGLPGQQEGGTQTPNGSDLNFVSDNPAYGVGLNEDGEAILGLPFTVQFETNGGTAVPDQKVEMNGHATEPNTTRSGYTLEGWYRDDGLTEKVTISTYPITGDTTFYANWEQNSDTPPSTPPGGPTTYKITVNPAENGTVTASKSTARSGETITVTLAPAEGYQRDTVTVVDKKNAAVTTSGDGNTVTFKMPASDVTVTGTFKTSSVTPPGGGSHWNDCPKDETCPIYPFTDANPKDWYHDGMHYCLDVGYVVGFGNFILGPNTPATRAQLVQILWNMEGKPAVDYQYTFEDVPADAWYASAVRWAASEGVIEGYSDKAFGPNDVMTREQFVTIMFRYAGNNGADVSARADLSGYNDAAKVSDWAKDAMEWAVANGIVVGRTETTLSPQGSLTRAELTTIIQRYETKLTDKAA